MTLPLPLRNRLAELILESLHDPKARSTLGALACFCGGPEDSAAPPEVVAEFPAALRREHRGFRKELCERTARAWDVVRGRPLAGREPPLAEALDQAADLFDARLFFEVHELLEPFWMSAEGAPREALQGLIQIAVGLHHFENGNYEGAWMLLDEGAAKVKGKMLVGRELTEFANGFHRATNSEGDSWMVLRPRFPRGG